MTPRMPKWQGGVSSSVAARQHQIAGDESSLQASFLGAVEVGRHVAVVARVDRPGDTSAYCGFPIAVASETSTRRPVSTEYT